MEIASQNGKKWIKTQSGVKVIDARKSPFELKEPNWVSDKDVERCQDCYMIFNMMNRRHHCRRCGRIFCDRCSSYYYSIPRMGFVDPVRNCRKCAVTARNERDFFQRDIRFSVMSSNDMQSLVNMVFGFFIWPPPWYSLAANRQYLVYALNADKEKYLHYETNINGDLTRNVSVHCRDSEELYSFGVSKNFYHANAGYVRVIYPENIVLKENANTRLLIDDEGQFRLLLLILRGGAHVNVWQQNRPNTAESRRTPSNPVSAVCYLDDTRWVLMISSGSCDYHFSEIPLSAIKSYWTEGQVREAFTGTSSMTITFDDGNLLETRFSACEPPYKEVALKWLTALQRAMDTLPVRNVESATKLTNCEIPEHFC